MIVDQAKRNAGFDFRREAAKPRIIIAHVEGSGTAVTGLYPIDSIIVNSGEEVV